MEEEDQARDAASHVEEGVSVACGSVGGGSVGGGMKNRRGTRQPLGDWILSFKFWMEGPAPDDSVGLPFARFPRR
jgi:hypothetical protein